MTSTSYLLSKIGLSFGFNRKTHWQTAANHEAALLHDAEQVLGYLCWENCENIDSVSFEYWNIRKLMLEYEEKSERLYNSEQKLYEIQMQRTEGLLEVSEGDPEIIAERRKLESNAELLLEERDAIVAEATDLKRQHEGLKLKIDVITEKEGLDSPKIEETKSKLREIKMVFLEHKKRREIIYNELNALDKTLLEIDRLVSESVVSKKSQVSDSYHEISTFNKEISTLRADLGALERELSELWADLGKNLSRNVNEIPELLPAIKDESSLVNKMTALRKSILLTQLLTSQA